MLTSLLHLGGEPYVYLHALQFSVIKFTDTNVTNSVTKTLLIPLKFFKNVEMVCPKEDFLLEIWTGKEVMCYAHSAFIKDFHSVSSSVLVSANTLFLAVSQKTQRLEINVKL